MYAKNLRKSKFKLKIKQSSGSKLKYYSLFLLKRTEQSHFMKPN